MVRVTKIAVNIETTRPIAERDGEALAPVPSRT